MTNRSPKTLTTYVGAANQLIAFLAAGEHDDRCGQGPREHAEVFIEDVLSWCRPATASNRHMALAPLFAYLVEEGEVTESLMAHLKPRLGRVGDGRVSGVHRVVTLRVVIRSASPVREPPQASVKMLASIGS